MEKAIKPHDVINDLREAARRAGKQLTVRKYARHMYVQCGNQQVRVTLKGKLPALTRLRRELGL